jgi:UDP-N-acetylglucosamine 3-dehydrogenase
VTALRAGVIGLGTMGRNHLRVLRELPGIEVVGAADPSLAARSGLGSTPVDTVTADVDELLDLRLDMCVVAAPTLAHPAIGLRLAAAGVHALIEKPLAADLASCIALAEEFERRGLVGCVGHIERYNVALRAMRDLLGELGPLFQIATRRQGPFQDRIRDVGVVMDLATHDIDLTCWVTGSSYLQVAAVTASPKARGHEDLVTVSGRLCDGTVASHLVNWLSPMKERVVTVTGARGCLIADTLAGKLWLRGDRDREPVVCPVPDREALRGELESFRDAVLGRPAGIVTMRQGAAAVAVAEAVIAAARDGACVTPAAARVLPVQRGLTPVVTDRTLADWGRVR